MKQLSKWQCEHCHTEYNTEENCKRCESNHKIKLKLKDKKCLSIGKDSCGYPSSINIKFEDGRVITYKRS